MRTVEEIQADIRVGKTRLDNAKSNGDAGEIAFCEAGNERLRIQLLDAITADIPLDRLEAICAAERDGRVVVPPCKQYETVWYILDGRVYIGWYLAKVGETTHLILQDRFEMGVCWATDGAWFFSHEAAEDALAALKGASNAE